VNALNQIRSMSLFCVIAMVHGVAHCKGIPEPVQQALARAKVPHDSVAVIVEPVLSGPVLVSHRPREQMHPASVMKLFTAQAALELLGPAFTFRTDILATGTIAGGVLSGDLVIRGGGDPKLTYEKVWQVAHHVRARGIREIRGDVILDRSYFAPMAPYDPGSFDKEPRRAYNVGPDALLVNFSAIDFRFIPDGEAVRVTAEPDLPTVEIASRIRIVPGPCGAWRQGLSYEVVENGMLATVVFSGTYPIDCAEKSWPLAILNPERYTEAVWRWVWSEAGGKLSGKVRSGTAPSDARLVYRHESEPLANLVRDTNKYSNNVMARHLFLALSAEPKGGGEAQASARIVSEWLARRAIEAPELVMENGSGLSRNERASAATIAALLRAAWSSPVMPELLASLPVLSVDGTLRQRGRLAGGQAHLKGGTLTGVQSVAGYVLDRRGRRWIVVMIVNDPSAGAAQPALDALVDWVYRSP
jgi:D-alanyl-D-alanine carboxypeptidase/D-alanyl-D-alanine-endopeptidase (penicillin-binding protein 4)